MKQNAKKKKGEFGKGTPQHLRTLPRGLREKLITLGEEIHTLIETRQFDEAERLCQSGLALIPKPAETYIEAAWYCSALGDICFFRGQFPVSRRNCEKALLILEKAGECDPFILLRPGETALETGDETAALRYLTGAYNAEGCEIFEGQDGKYYDFLNEHINTEQKGQGL